MKLLPTLILSCLLSIMHQPDALAAPIINTLEKSGLFKYKQSEVAIRGYDTVAYFTQGKAVKGLKEHSIEWRGAQWRFATIAHRTLFEKNPERFAPQFGGYCAFGISQGYLAKIEGELWSITEGKLYLNYSRKFHRKWSSDKAHYIELADARFETLLAE